jgi:hypothetical protein
MLDHLNGLAKTRMMMCVAWLEEWQERIRPESGGIHDQILNVDERIILGSHPFLGLSITSKQKEKKQNKMELRQKLLTWNSLKTSEVGSLPNSKHCDTVTTIQ